MRDGQQTTTSEDSATQLLICEALSLAKKRWHCLRCWRPAFAQNTLVSDERSQILMALSMLPKDRK